MGDDSNYNESNLSEYRAYWAQLLKYNTQTDAVFSFINKYHFNPTHFPSITNTSTVEIETDVVYVSEAEYQILQDYYNSLTGNKNTAFKSKFGYDFNKIVVVTTPVSSVSFTDIEDIKYKNYSSVTNNNSLATAYCPNVIWRNGKCRMKVTKIGDNIKIETTDLKESTYEFKDSDYKYWINYNKPSSGNPDKTTDMSRDDIIRRIFEKPSFIGLELYRNFGTFRIINGDISDPKYLIDIVSNTVHAYDENNNIWKYKGNIKEVIPPKVLIYDIFHSNLWWYPGVDERLIRIDNDTSGNNYDENIDEIWSVLNGMQDIFNAAEDGQVLKVDKTGKSKAGITVDDELNIAIVFDSGNRSEAEKLAKEWFNMSQVSNFWRRLTLDAYSKKQNDGNPDSESYIYSREFFYDVISKAVINLNDAQSVLGLLSRRFASNRVVSKNGVVTYNPEFSIEVEFDGRIFDENDKNNFVGLTAPVYKDDNGEWGIIIAAFQDTAGIWHDLTVVRRPAGYGIKTATEENNNDVFALGLVYDRFKPENYSDTKINLDVVAGSKSNLLEKLDKRMKLFNGDSNNSNYQIYNYRHFNVPGNILKSVGVNGSDTMSKWLGTVSRIKVTKTTTKITIEATKLGTTIEEIENNYPYKIELDIDDPILNTTVIADVESRNNIKYMFENPCYVGLELFSNFGAFRIIDGDFHEYRKMIDIGTYDVYEYKNRGDDVIKIGKLRDIFKRKVLIYDDFHNTLWWYLDQTENLVKLNFDEHLDSYEYNHVSRQVEKLWNEGLKGQVVKVNPENRTLYPHDEFIACKVVKNEEELNEEMNRTSTIDLSDVYDNWYRFVHFYGPAVYNNGPILDNSDYGLAHVGQNNREPVGIARGSYQGVFGSDSPYLSYDLTQSFYLNKGDPRGEGWTIDKENNMIKLNGHYSTAHWDEGHIRVDDTMLMTGFVYKPKEGEEPIEFSNYEITVQMDAGWDDDNIMIILGFITAEESEDNQEHALYLVRGAGSFGSVDNMDTVFLWGLIYDMTWRTQKIIIDMTNGQSEENLRNNGLKADFQTNAGTNWDKNHTVCYVNVKRTTNSNGTSFTFKTTKWSRNLNEEIKYLEPDEISQNNQTFTFDSNNINSKETLTDMDRRHIQKILDKKNIGFGARSGMPSFGIVESKNAFSKEDIYALHLNMVYTYDDNANEGNGGWIEKGKMGELVSNRIFMYNKYMKALYFYTSPFQWIQIAALDSIDKKATDQVFKRMEVSMGNCIYDPAAYGGSEDNEWINNYKNWRTLKYPESTGISEDDPQYNRMIGAWILKGTESSDMYNMYQVFRNIELYVTGFNADYNILGPYTNVKWVEVRSTVLLVLRIPSVPRFYLTIPRSFKSLLGYRVYRVSNDISLLENFQQAGADLVQFDGDWTYELGYYNGNQTLNLISLKVPRNPVSRVVVTPKGINNYFREAPNGDISGLIDKYDLSDGSPIQTTHGCYLTDGTNENMDLDAQNLTGQIIDLIEIDQRPYTSIYGHDATGNFETIGIKRCSNCLMLMHDFDPFWPKSGFDSIKQLMTLPPETLEDHIYFGYDRYGTSYTTTYPFNESKLKAVSDKHFISMVHFHKPREGADNESIDTPVTIQYLKDTNFLRTKTDIDTYESVDHCEEWDDGPVDSDLDWATYTDNPKY